MDSEIKLVTEEMRGPWFVVSMKKRWTATQIDRSNKPTLLFQSLADAVKEAARLLDIHPGQQYGVFECIGKTRISGWRRLKKQRLAEKK